jgi:secondary thiamine-phosphate synthase enzyme
LPHRDVSPTNALVRQELGELVVSSAGRALHEITAEVARWLRGVAARRGLLTLMVRHTSASLLIQENADPDVLRDLETFFSRLARDGDPAFVHTAEGPDDMSSHVRAALTQSSLSIPVDGGAMLLGTWQGLFLYEHRHAPHERRVALHYVGD